MFWDSLRFQPYFTATASNIGYSWWSHDIGGHMQGYRDDELAVRWLQLGVFSPINRLHSACDEFQRKEPWCYKPRIGTIMKDWLRLRHGFFPYLYTMNYRNHKELIPLILPMYYTHPKCREAYEERKRYWFGSELMVAPITEHSSAVTDLVKAEVWLPKGDWYDFFNGTHYHSEKGRKMNMYRDLNQFPVLAREGAIIPMAQYADNQLVNASNMEVLVFPGRSNSFTLYEDEGELSNYKDGAYAMTEFSLNWDDAPKFVIHPAVGDLSLIPKTRKWHMIFRGWDTEIQVHVTANGRSIPFTFHTNLTTHSVTVEFEASVAVACVIT